ncbi:hypothetical protein RRG08_023738 [Elysia crispata]|uniref:Uncharacterized protein n=1 Tax=Elysia crispata TaxID=231223 RepID=A0AAE1DNI4_9GAST|nr:hypothetical protein RRG08_023738 [Elysia crispata]
MDLLLFLLPELSDRKTYSNCPSLTMKMEISHNPDLEEDVHFLKKQQELGLRQAKVFQTLEDTHSQSSSLGTEQEKRSQACFGRSRVHQKEEGLHPPGTQTCVDGNSLQAIINIGD